MSTALKGILLVDKPVGITSHDVVDRIRKASGIRRVGHTGTLDPAATGLLILCIGPATRLSEHLTGLDKVYEGDMRFGLVTDSYDMDGQVVSESPVPDLTPEQIQGAFDRFTGDIEQVPPMVSAVKVGGERLYKKARKGEVVERPARAVTVREFALLEYAPPVAHFRVQCTSGTYVRSLCHEVGEGFGCGAVLAALRRTAVGRHRVEDALPVDAFKTPDDVRAQLVPLGDALTLPAVVALPSGKRLIRSGATLTGGDIADATGLEEGWVQIKSADGDLLALGQIKREPSGPCIVPRRVFVESRP